MKKCLVVLAAVGVASVASAQSDGWILEADLSELKPGQATATLTLLATFPTADYAFAGARLSISASEAGWGTLEKVEPGSSGPGTSAGIAAGGDVTGIILGQVHFPPPIMADPSNPQPVWRGEFTVDLFTVRSVDFSTQTTAFAIYPDSASPASRTGTPTEAMARIAVIPAPGSLALLGLAGLAAARRRR